jgi:hypothetical protein
MKATEGSSRVLVTVPPDVRRWLEQTARYHGGTMSGEAVRCMRERMDREGAAAGKDCAVTAAAAE